MNQLVDPVYLAVKAAFASALAVLLTRWLGGTDLLSAGFVALVCTSPSAHAGLRRGIQQTAGSLLGALAAGLPQLPFPALRGHPIALALSMAAALLSCFRLRLGPAYVVTGFTVLYFHVLPFPSFGVALWTRMLSVTAGILASTLVNSAVASFGSAHIVERRLTLARHTVALELRKLASRVTITEGPWPDFEQAFAAVAELRQDLVATSAERLFPGAARARSSASAGLRQAIALEDAAHLGKELSLLQERAATPSSILGEVLEQTARALEGAPSPELPPIGDPVLASVVGRLLEVTTHREP